MIAYLTDIEGQWRKLADFVHDNPVVKLSGDKLDVAEGAVFVYGGDAIDRGPEGRRIVRTLLDAKRRMPDRVVLLAGNRDINKLRLLKELQGYFFYPLPDELKNVDRPTLLRWIFRFTMGAPNAFAHRQSELGTADDEAVVQSIFADILPGGDIAEYLRHAQLAYRSGATLFVHGGVTNESLGHVPELDPIAEPDAWIAALNRWYAQQIQSYYDLAKQEPDNKSWTPLIMYQAPTRFSRRNQASVVYGRTTDEHNNPHLPDDVTMASLTRAGIHRLVVGHTPMGDAPSIIRASDFEIVFADNSYGPLEHGTQLLLEDQRLRMRARSRTSAGDEVDLVLTIPDAKESFIGLRDEDTGEIVKGRTTDGRYLLQRYGSGFALDQQLVTEEALKQRKLVLPRGAIKTA